MRSNHQKKVGTDKCIIYTRYYYYNPILQFPGDPSDQTRLLKVTKMKCLRLCPKSTINLIIIEGFTQTNRYLTEFFLCEAYKVGWNFVSAKDKDNLNLKKNHLKVPRFLRILIFKFVGEETYHGKC